jgi:hypothetical protein
MEPSLDFIGEDLGRFTMCMYSSLQILQPDKVEGSTTAKNIMGSCFKHVACRSPSLSIFKEQSIEFCSSISL